MCRIWILLYLYSVTVSVFCIEVRVSARPLKSSQACLALYRFVFKLVSEDFEIMIIIFVDNLLLLTRMGSKCNLKKKKKKKKTKILFKSTWQSYKLTYSVWLNHPSIITQYHVLRRLWDLTLAQVPILSCIFIIILWTPRWTLFKLTLFVF